MVCSVSEASAFWRAYARMTRAEKRDRRLRGVLVFPEARFRKRYISPLTALSEQRDTLHLVSDKIMNAVPYHFRLRTLSESLWR
jgi:hypothetical protein